MSMKRFETYKYISAVMSLIIINLYMLERYIASSFIWIVKVPHFTYMNEDIKILSMIITCAQFFNRQQYNCQVGKFIKMARTFKIEVT